MSEAGRYRPRTYLSLRCYLHHSPTYADRCRRAHLNASRDIGFANALPVIDGRGRYLDNIFIERLWRSLKQKATSLAEISDGFQARRVIKNWMALYNPDRPHSALDQQTQHEAYWSGLKEQKPA
ncbi:MAG: integrase core domain-containing protein [Pseudomonadota bacterium]